MYSTCATRPDIQLTASERTDQTKSIFFFFSFCYLSLSRTVFVSLPLTVRRTRVCSCAREIEREKKSFISNHFNVYTYSLYSLALGNYPDFVHSLLRYNFETHICQSLDATKENIRAFSFRLLSPGREIVESKNAR